MQEYSRKPVWRCANVKSQASCAGDMQVHTVAELIGYYSEMQYLGHAVDEATFLSASSGPASAKKQNTGKAISSAARIISA
jgi:hypothetical protein